jgi:glycine hydroxymethyltransferase
MGELSRIDPAIAQLIQAELVRERRVLDMVAAENLASPAVLEAQGSVLTNKYADGYPAARLYDGCEVVDEIELLAIERAKALFGADHANVQPYSGSNANAAVLHALVRPGETILGFDFAQGGHPTQHDGATFAGRFYQSVTYGVRREDGILDYEQIEMLAKDHHPKVIFAGGSCYPRQIDFARFRAIADEVGAYLVADMAHIAGLVAARLHPDPVPHADVCTMTMHKTLGGARGGVILSRSELAPRIDAAVFPGEQGGPLPHVIAAKAVTLLLAQTPDFAERIERTLRGARIIADLLHEASTDTKMQVLTGGTDVHLFALDTFEAGVTAGRALMWLHFLGITGNAMTIPFDRAKPPDSSGLRLGTALLATRGFKDEDFAELGDILVTRFSDLSGPTLVQLRERTQALSDRFPIYADLEASTHIDSA